MAVGGVGSKGRAGGVGGPKGPSSSGGGKFRVDSTGGAGKTEGLVGPSGASGSGNVSGSGGASGAQGAQAAADPVMARAMDIARQLREGQIPNREEATRKFVSEILREKLHRDSKALTSKIADALQDDPRLNQALERLWSKG